MAPMVIIVGLLMQFPLGHVVAKTYRESSQKHSLLIEAINGLETIKAAGAEGQIQRQWETLGNQDPYWAVLSDHSKMGGKWSKEEFFATGEIEIDAALRKTRDLGIELKYSTMPKIQLTMGLLIKASIALFAISLGIQACNDDDVSPKTMVSTSLSPVIKLSGLLAFTYSPPPL